MVSKTESLSEITERLKNHYEQTVRAHGSTPRGVDWRDQETADIRYGKMLSILAIDANRTEQRPSVLDVGCGYGGLLDYVRSHTLDLHYVGIDISSDMIDIARSRNPNVEFECADLLSMKSTLSFDYVLCNGIFTQKLEISDAGMISYIHAAVNKMFSLCENGIAFNLMTDLVNFKVENLCYVHPSDFLRYCLENVSRYTVIDHSYPLYEFTVYCLKRG